MKLCKKCGLVGDFYKRNTKTGFRFSTFCKLCHNLDGRTRHQKRALDPEYRASRVVSNRFRKYKLSNEAYCALRDLQNNACAVCETDNPGRGHKNFSVDHCHETGKVRGLLCHGNAGNGITDNPDLLLKKIIYLQKHGKLLSSDVMKDLLS